MQYNNYRITIECKHRAEGCINELTDESSLSIDGTRNRARNLGWQIDNGKATCPFHAAQSKPKATFPDRLRVYVAGPYTQGDVACNVATAIGMADMLAFAGFAPYVPHLNHFWHMHHPQPREVWLNLNNQFLPLCHAVYRIHGESEGADKEVALAKQLNIPVFDTMDGLKAHFSTPRQVS